MGFPLVPRRRLCAKTRYPSQNLHWRYSHEKHSEFHRPAWNDNWAIRFQSSECVSHDLFDWDVNEFWPAFDAFARPSCYFLEFGVHRARTQSADTHACSADLGAERFGDAGDVRFGCGVNREPRDRKKPGG